MYLNPKSEATWCKYFLTTLKGVAQTWITKGVKEGSISSWQDLSNKFKSKFSTANCREKTTAELMSLHQVEDESLRDYLTRFSNESSRITNLDQGLATLEEALDGSDKFIRAEEWNKAKSQSHSGAGKSRGQLPEGPAPRKGKAKASEPSSAAEPKKEKFDPYAGRYDSYTPVALPRTKIFSTTKDEGRFKKPR
ncbi:uncharacterized protein LOC110701769 [Chenopodium quinoa]|uniref:uncharacterized protein LOC110701769 n=1 Tax=Chenopodium quinoa TaxID=63459 RepID=UPI000B79A5CE|nr:uncharacterized protein LOC110701769 [Chenopodium quinoa]